MLISPSRADCIIFSDDALVDGSAAFTDAASKALARCLGDVALDDLSSYLCAAADAGLTRIEIVRALLSGVRRNGGSLPAPSVWERNLSSAVVALSAEELRAVEKAYTEAYFGTGNVPPAEASSLLEKPLYRKRWDALPFPVGIMTRRSADELSPALNVLGWHDFPKNRIISSTRSAEGSTIESLCRSMNTKWPFFLLANHADLRLAETLGRGDLIAVGHLTHADIRFASAADAIRAILGII